MSNYRDTISYDKTKLNRFPAGMHDRGIRVIGRGIWYIGVAHVEEDIDHALTTAEEVLSII
ncbi:MAG: hypothetical protein WD426_19580 [Anditalea sp.]